MEHAFQQGRRIFQQQTGDLPQPKDTDQHLGITDQTVNCSI